MSWGLDDHIARYLAALRWRRQIEQGLRPLQLTLTQWLVLDAVNAIRRESADAVSQRQVGRHLALDKATVSVVMRQLERRALVDRGPACDGPQWRIVLTTKGQRLLDRSRALMATRSRG